MTNLQKKMFAAVSSVVISMSTVSPAFAATTITISGNGSNSDNTSNVTLDSTRTVVQSNEANVTNNVESNASTGGNDANDNTGGDVQVHTGDAESNVSVSNNLNSNTATLDCCLSGDTTVLISGNGTQSDNDVNLDRSNNTEVYQDNQANVTNNVESNAKTGYNDANDNTGGDVQVHTGNAESNVEVSTAANANTVAVGGSNGDSGEVSVRILNNGSNSDNSVDLDLANTSTVVQENDANVSNDVDSNAKTGENDANDNTGGEIFIHTGEADATAEVDNMVNFNWAAVDCACLLDLSAKIDGNGTYSDNDLTLSVDDTQEIFQGGKEDGGNSADLDNDVDANAKTGYNDAEDNTQGSDEDPSIETGDATSEANVSNSGNVNVVGGDDAEWPDFDWDFNVSMSWDQLMAFFQMM